MRYCKSEDEVLQGVNYGFMKVLKNIKKYNEEFALATWIRTILVNHLIDEYRKTEKQIENVSIEDIELPEKDGDINLAEYRFSEKQLRQMLEKLPKVTCTVFNLFAIEGYSHGQIAELLKISKGTSKWHVSEARKRLASLLKEAENEDVKLKTTTA